MGDAADDVVEQPSPPVISSKFLNPVASAKKDLFTNSPFDISDDESEEFSKIAKKSVASSPQTAG